MILLQRMVKTVVILKCNDVFINLKEGVPETISTQEAISLYEVRDEELSQAPKCEKCNKPLAIRDGKWGKWYSCTGFPKCKHKQTQKP